jgi:hypothetical protein
LPDRETLNLNHLEGIYIYLSAKMDALKAVQTYIIKMLDEVSGMKVLLMDAHTVSFLSIGYATKHEIDRFSGWYRRPSYRWP